MATPTPGKLPHVVATPPVSTPFSTNHLAFSPHGPRSVIPSPQAVKKSPANSNTLYGYSSGGGHPTNSSFGIGYDSPSAAMALANVPGLGELGLDGMGAPGMTVDVLGRADDDERRRKLMQVWGILKHSKGRLSEAGIERLARRLGLECLWDPPVGSGGAARTLIIAGSALALDIDFVNNVVKKVALSFHESPEVVSRHTERAGKILLRDLQVGPRETPLTKMLDRFAANLEQLATLDQLSIIPGLNCHEAIAGIYESLERLHKWEIARLKEQDDIKDKDDEYFERMALCSKSGKSVMHAKQRVGLSIDYWKEKRYISKKTKHTVDEEKTWSMLVECAPAPTPPLAYTPIRISENWISADIQKINPAAEELILVDGHGPVLDWLEPENTLLTSSEPSKMEGLEGMGGIGQASGHKYPEVMFLTKFDPPLIVPYGVAMQIHSSVNAHLDMYQATTFDGLMFPYGPNKADVAEARTIGKRTAVTVLMEDGTKTTKIHQNTLFIEKIDFGRTLTELPFSHPRQLVEILPVLRQYAFLSTLLRKSFSGTDCHSFKQPESPRRSKWTELEEFMADDVVPHDAPLTLDVSLATQPLPRLHLAFPFKDRTANIVFDIKLNGAVEVTSQNVLEDVGEDGQQITVADLGRMLEITEDLGIWAEYVRRRLE